MKRFIVMTCGYAEEAQVSVLVYQCGYFGHRGYKSIKQAITELALDLYAKFYDERLSVYEDRYGVERKPCCQHSLTFNQQAKYCSVCGSQLSDLGFDGQEFMQFVRELSIATTDSYGESEETTTRPLSWSPYCPTDLIGAPKKDVIYIAENAEAVLLHALIQAKPEILTRKSEGEEHWCQDWAEYFSQDKQPEYE